MAFFREISQVTGKLNATTNYADQRQNEDAISNIDLFVDVNSEQKVNIYTCGIIDRL